MGASAELKKLRPKIVPPGAEDRCAICGATKPLEKAHIIPVELFKSIADVIKNDKDLLIDQDSHNIMVLCCNHHTLYDRFQLSPLEFALIYNKVFSVLMVLSYYINQTLRRGTAMNDQFFQDALDFITKFELYGRGTER